MIKGITPRLAELGKIRIGKKDAQVRQTKSGGTWRAPEKLDHFLITGCGRDAKGDLKVDQRLMDRLVREYGDEDGKLRQLPISLLSDDVDEVITASYCRYDGRSLTAHCDGETCTWLRDKNGNAINKQIPCSGEHEQKPWKLHATLACVIASGEASWGGVYKFRTTSRITVDQLYGSLLHLQSLTSGILQGVPLRLVVRPVEVSPEGKATTVYVVHIELRGADLSAVQQQVIQLAQVRIQNERQLRSVRSEYLKLLKAPGVDEDELEQADVAEEFDPGERQALPARGETTDAVIDVAPEPKAAAAQSKPDRKRRQRADVDEYGEPVEVAAATETTPQTPSGGGAEPTSAATTSELSLDSLPF
jgi:hypothetical protein